MRAPLMFSLLILAGALAMPARAIDSAGYVDRAQRIADTIRNTDLSGIDAAIVDQERLLALGLAALDQFAAEYPEFAGLMAFVADSVPAMTEMTLEEIEIAWHEGGALIEAGFENTTHDHFGVINSVMDMVVHPATSLIALRVYRETGDPAMLEQIRDEMSEVLEHLQHI